MLYQPGIVSCFRSHEATQMTQRNAISSLLFTKYEEVSIHHANISSPAAQDLVLTAVTCKGNRYDVVFDVERPSRLIPACLL